MLQARDAWDNMCVGNPQSTDDNSFLCVDDVKFESVVKLLRKDWSTDFVQSGEVDGIFGLGKEPANNDSEGFLARAYN